MTKWKPAPVQVLIALNAMLLFFVLLDDRLAVPLWLQVGGRLHPLILHFPIVLIVGYTICLWFAGKNETSAVNRMAAFADHLLLWAAFAAVVTALAGIFLSREAVYEGAAIQWHKWLGTLTSLALLALYLGKDSAVIGKHRQKWMAILPLTAVAIAGHLGGDLTHGAGFVLAPLKPAAAPAPSFDEALVYQDLVEPIVAARCMQCHNSGTTKGGLNMEDPTQFAKGGRTGKPWDTTAEGLGLLATRIHLPPDDRKHMPPVNKTQLTEQEEKTLYAWIRAGAPFDKKVTDLAPTDTLRIIAARLLKSTDNENFDFSPADEKTIASLKTNYRTIAPIAIGSPGLAVDFYGAAFFQPAQLKDLSSIKEQIVSLNLDKMPVTDNDLSYLAAFRNLRKLNLDFTRITAAGIPTLTKFTRLQSLSLSGTQLTAGDLDRLAGISSLRKLYLWKTGIAEGSVAKMRRQRKDLQLITGFNGDTVRIKLNAPKLETDARIIRDTALLVKLRHFVPGATMRYTLDGSDPDSAGRLYSGPFRLQDRSQFRAKAYKPGWLASDATTATFYTQKYPPDSIHLLLPVDSNYMKFHPTVLIDGDKGDFGFGSGKWLGFHKNGLAATLYYRKPVVINDLSFSGVVDIGAYIFPPTRLEVWGGPDEHHLRQLGTMTPVQPDKAVAAYMTDFRISFPAVTVRCLKVIADPVKKLPAWHPGKGQPGWIFFDELLVN
ncbi:FN3 associated domain-containing protein [Puia sp.]|jgi:uncharacterized membrane protein|uniref:FN3 associated domain-containing protein n=1 Tax=Puia sp. TaxID=2045100 RepID=UPI002F3F6D8C